MTVSNHQHEAERILTTADRLMDGNAPAVHRMNAYQAAIATAQVHAILALVEALTKVDDGRLGPL